MKNINDIGWKKTKEGDELPGFILEGFEMEAGGVIKKIRSSGIGDDPTTEYYIQFPQKGGIMLRRYAHGRWCYSFFDLSKLTK